MSEVVYGFAALALLAIAVLGAVWLRHRSYHVTERMRLLEDAFRDAGVLIDEDDTPDQVVDLLDLIAHNARNPRINMRFFWAVVSGALRKEVGKPSAKALAFKAAVKSMRPEMREVYDRAIAAFLLASTYNNPLIGWFIRRATFYAFEKDPAQAESVISAMDWRRHVAARA
jgi:hypothetical protein